MKKRHDLYPIKRENVISGWNEGFTSKNFKSVIYYMRQWMTENSSMIGRVKDSSGRDNSSL